MKDSFSSEEAKRCVLMGRGRKTCYGFYSRHSVIWIFCFGTGFTLVFANISITTVILVFTATTVWMSSSQRHGDTHRWARGVIFFLQTRRLSIYFFLSESVLKVVCRSTPRLNMTHFHTEMQHFDNNCFSLAWFAFPRWYLYIYTVLWLCGNLIIVTNICLWCIVLEHGISNCSSRDKNVSGCFISCPQCPTRLRFHSDHPVEPFRPDLLPPGRGT